MRQLTMIVGLSAITAFGSTATFAEESLDTLLPPPGWLRRNAEALEIDAATRQKLEDTYDAKEPKYHRLKYKVERLTNQLHPALVADTLDEETIVKQMKELLNAENELKLYQVHVRLSLMSHLTKEERQAAQDGAKADPPGKWRGELAAKVEQVRKLGEQVAARGGSLDEFEKQMQKIDASFAKGDIAAGKRMLDDVIQKLESTLKR